MDLREKNLQIINSIGNSPDKLIEVLIEAQAKSENHYLSESDLKIISKEMDIPLSKAYGVATFYSMLSTKKRGKYVIQVCNSGPCYLNGGREISEMFEAILGIKMGDITDDELFSLEFTSCIGCCDIAPAIKINDEVYGNLNRDKVVEIIKTLREGEQ